jgi:hypothetical protein
MTREDVLLSLVKSGELEIDTDGRIWRLMKRGGNPTRNYAVRPCPKVRAEFKTRDGYLLVTTTINGEKTTASAHRMVWTYFRGLIPDGLTINHLNGKKDDNHLANLDLATLSEQRRHAIDVLNVNRNRPKGERNPKAQTTAEQVIEMRRSRAMGMPVKDLAAVYGMKPKAISAICCRRTWKHIA